MSRADEQGFSVFEISAVAQCFSEWVHDDSNAETLVMAINTAVTEYETDRDTRVHTLGYPKPAVHKSSNEPDTEEFTLLDPEPEEVIVQPVDPTIAEQILRLAGTACLATQYGVRLFSATVIDFSLTNTVEQFKKTFPEVIAKNAKFAFVYIEQLESEWASLGYGSRASLNTRILTAVFNQFISHQMKQRSTCQQDCAFDLLDSSESTSLADFFVKYMERHVDLLRDSVLAKNIFLGFSSTDQSKDFMPTFKEFFSPKAAQKGM